jgi:hypothetical protein
MIIIALLAVALLAGAIVILLAVVVLCVRNEDRHGALPHHGPTRTTRAVRSLTGLRVCPPDQAYLCRRPIRHNAPRRASCANQTASRPHATDQPATSGPPHDTAISPQPTRHARRSA